MASCERSVPRRKRSAITLRVSASINERWRVSPHVAASIKEKRRVSLRVAASIEAQEKRHVRRRNGGRLLLTPRPVVAE